MHALFHSGNWTKTTACQSCCHSCGTSSRAGCALRTRPSPQFQCPTVSPVLIVSMCSSSADEFDDLVAVVHDPLCQSTGVDHIQGTLPQSACGDQDAPLMSSKAGSAIERLLQSVNLHEIFPDLESVVTTSGAHFVAESLLHPTHSFDCGGEETVSAEDVSHVFFLGVSECAVGFHPHQHLYYTLSAQDFARVTLFFFF